jgi:hypothetical protein
MNIVYKINFGNNFDEYKCLKINDIVIETLFKGSIK